MYIWLHSYSVLHVEVLVWSDAIQKSILTTVYPVKKAAENEPDEQTNIRTTYDVMLIISGKKNVTCKNGSEWNFSTCSYADKEYIHVRC